VPPRPDPSAPVPTAPLRGTGVLPAPGATRVRARRAERGAFEPAYVTRKRLTGQELLAAAGVGLGLALAGFYLAKVWIERSDVLPPTRPPADPAGDAPAGAVNRTVTPQRAAP
jgi:hypothetical protein